MREFLFRARVAGIDQTPAFVEAFAAMRAESDACERLREAEKAGTIGKAAGEFWKDGEYDSSRAEDANDRYDSFYLWCTLSSF